MKHTDACDCYASRNLKARTIGTDAWKLKHLKHVAVVREFTRERANHPSGTWHWLVCPCGAKHLTTEAEATA